MLICDCELCQTMIPQGYTPVVLEYVEEGNSCTGYDEENTQQGE